MDKTILPNLIKQARLNAGLTQASASEYLGISKRTIGSWEDGSRTPSTGVLLAVAEKLLAYPKKSEAVYSAKEGIYSLSEIISIVRRVVQTEDVSRVVLFGSYAKGLAKATSDVGLLVETPLTGLAFFGLAEKLKNALKKEVDVIGSNEVIPNGRVDEEIKNAGIVIYERKNVEKQKLVVCTRNKQVLPRDIGPDGRMLCEIQGRIFEESLTKFKGSSPIFVRRFMLSETATFFDDKTYLIQSSSDNSVLEDLEKEFGPTSYGQKRFSADELHWMGYMYRFWCLSTGYSSKRVFHLCKSNTMVSYFAPLHTQDPSAALDTILLAVGYDNEDINVKGLRILHEMEAESKTKNTK